MVVMRNPEKRLFDSGRSTTAGLIMPPLFGFVVLLQDLWRADFDSLRRFISELAIGPFGWIQIVNFLVSGTLLVLFARGAVVHFSVRAPRIGSYLLAIIGVSMFLSGVFVADPPDQATWHGALHLVFGLTVFTLIPISCLVFLWHFTRDEKWHELRHWTLLTVLVAGAFWIALIPGGVIPAFARLIDPFLEPLYSRLGLANRVVVGTWLVWVFLFSLHIRRRIART